MAGSSGTAQALTRTWIGNSSTDWATGDWSATPVSTDALVFGAAGTLGASLTNTLTNSASNIAGITFNGTSSAYTFAGSGNVTISGPVTKGNAVAFDSSVVSHAFTAGALSGTGNLVLQDNAGTPNPVALTVGGNDASTLYSGNLTGSGTLTKTGTGTLTLSGSVGVAGMTANSGSLQIAQSGTIGSLNIGAAGTFEITANNVNSAKVLVNSADYGWLDFYYGYGLTVGDLNGDGQVNSADYNGIDYGYGYQAYGVLAGVGGTPAAVAASAPVPSESVPEPGTLGLLLAGAVGLLRFHRPKRSRV